MRKQLDINNLELETNVAPEEDQNYMLNNN